MNPADYIANHAETQGREALANARATMERALAELDHYIARYEEVEDLTDKANVLNSTLNHLATYVASNVRLDLIAGAQAELMRVDARR
jgi:enamine deaminase RidA (YjgF/YER057c/UK114 family)